MSKAQINLQDSFLNALRKESIPVILYLISGVQLRGHVRGFDPFTVILEGQGRPPQLVYKHAIVSVAPQRHFENLGGMVAANESTEGAPEPQAGAEAAA